MQRPSVGWRTRVVMVIATLMGDAADGLDTSRLRAVRQAPFDPRIHNLGNTGVGGFVHAKCAKFATDLIDARAYGGRNVRKELAQLMRQRKVPRVAVEVGCGVGTLTQELVYVDYFSDILAVDTSRQMVNEARRRVQNVTFEVANGCDLSNSSSGLAVASFVMHELPTEAHEDLLQTMLLATEGATDGQVWIADIELTYTPSRAMLAGEPYIAEYLANFNETIRRVAGGNGCHVSSLVLVANHVRVWVVERP